MTKTSYNRRLSTGILVSGKREQTNQADCLGASWARNMRVIRLIPARRFRCGAIFLGKPAGNSIADRSMNSTKQLTQHVFAILFLQGDWPACLHDGYSLAIKSVAEFIMIISVRQRRQKFPYTLSKPLSKPCIRDAFAEFCRDILGC